MAGDQQALIEEAKYLLYCLFISLAVEVIGKLSASDGLFHIKQRRIAIEPAARRKEVNGWCAGLAAAYRAWVYLKAFVSESNFDKTVGGRMYLID
ncbi:hypothetical protein [Pseudomonas aeruginosa]|uniref:hypothetical protein n=1 Tax=Pseudomonas aeruginosa TaxID=287 RepID=UPI0031FEE145